MVDWVSIQFKPSFYETLSSTASFEQCSLFMYSFRKTICGQYIKLTICGNLSYEIVIFTVKN